MKLQLKTTPQESIDQYNLQALQVDGWFYIDIQKGMSGLKQAACLANDRLVQHLAPYGYIPVNLSLFLEARVQWYCILFIG